MSPSTVPSDGGTDAGESPPLVNRRRTCTLALAVLAGAALMVVAVTVARGSEAAGEAAMVAPAPAPLAVTNLRAQYNPPAWARARLAVQAAKEGKAPPKFGDDLMKQLGAKPDELESSPSYVAPPGAPPPPPPPPKPPVVTEISATSELNKQFAATNLMDGSTKTGWCSSHATGSFTLMLGRHGLVSGIQFFFEPKYGPDHIIISGGGVREPPKQIVKTSLKHEKQCRPFAWCTVIFPDNPDLAKIIVNVQDVYDWDSLEVRIREIRIISPDGTVPFGIKNADDEEDEDEPSMYDRSPGGDDGGGRDYEMDKDHSDPDSRKPDSGSESDDDKGPHHNHEHEQKGKCDSHLSGCRTGKQTCANGVAHCSECSMGYISFNQGCSQTNYGKQHGGGFNGYGRRLLESSWGYVQQLATHKQEGPL